MTSLELIETTVVTRGFGHSKVVAMSTSYSELAKHCEKTYGKSPVEGNHIIQEGEDKVYQIKQSEVPIILA